MLEVLLAVTLVAVIVTIFYGAFSGTLDTVEAIESQEETLRRGNFAMKSLIRNLSSAFLAYRAHRVDLDFIGETNTSEIGEGDRLIFFSTYPMRGSQSIQTSLKMVVYDVELTDKPTLADQLLTRADRFGSLGPELLVLRCFEIPQIGQAELDPQGQLGSEIPQFGTAVPQDQLGFGTDTLAARDFGQTIDLASLDPEELVQDGGTVWRIPIAGFNVEYSDGEGWLPEWRAIENGGLPRAVRVQIAISDEKTLKRWALEGEEFEPAIIETIVTLPLGMSNLEETEEEEELSEEESEQQQLSADRGGGGGQTIDPDEE